MGGSTSVGAQGSYAGTGGGFNVSTSSQGQWGTKSLNTQQSQVTRTAEAGQEKRETFSHTTQLSQMYHLLDSYHLGTNRAVFFVQPRPHVLEEPSGFVRGPRPVEGIQEFFLVVATPKDAKDFCVSVRVDTSHLAETDVLDFEHRTDVSDLAVASARVPNRNDIPDGTTSRRACAIIDCWDVTYHCFRTRDVQDQVYTAPDGFVIEGFDDLVNQSANGSTSVSIAPGNKTLTVHAEASGHICFEGSEVCFDCPDEIEKWAGSARRQVQVRLRSELPIRKVGTKQVLLITTRGLCCCGDSRQPTHQGAGDGGARSSRLGAGRSGASQGRHGRPAASTGDAAPGLGDGPGGAAACALAHDAAQRTAPHLGRAQVDPRHDRHDPHGGAPAGPGRGRRSPKRPPPISPSCMRRHRRRSRRPAVAAKAGGSPWAARSSPTDAAE